MRQVDRKSYYYKAKYKIRISNKSYFIHSRSEKLGNVKNMKKEGERNRERKERL